MLVFYIVFHFFYLNLYPKDCNIIRKQLIFKAVNGALKFLRIQRSANRTPIIKPLST